MKIRKCLLSSDHEATRKVAAGVAFE